MIHDVFISYSTKNKSVADFLCAALESAAIRCWIAPRDVQPGLPFAGEITRAIHRSKAMVLIFSTDSNKSEQIVREVGLADNARLPIIQLRIEDLTPNDDLRYYLSTPHWFDATTQPLEKHLGGFTIAIKTLLKSPEKGMKKSVAKIAQFGKHYAYRSSGWMRLKKRRPGSRSRHGRGHVRRKHQVFGRPRYYADNSNFLVRATRPTAPRHTSAQGG